MRQSAADAGRCTGNYSDGPLLLGHEGSVFRRVEGTSKGACSPEKLRISNRAVLPAKLFRRDSKVKVSISHRKMS